MKKLEGEKKLNELIGSGAKVWVDSKSSVLDYINDSEDLMDWVSELDNKVFVKGVDMDIDDYTIITYGVDCESHEYTACIIFDSMGDVFAYGYTGD